MLDEIYPVELVKKRTVLAFLLGICYAIVGMGGALFLFPKDPAMIAVALTAMLAFPLIRKLSEPGENEKSQSFIQILKQNTSTFKIYLFLFLGAFLTFAFFSLMLPAMAAGFLFKNQLSVYFGNITGNAFNSGTFLQLFNNNLRVLMLAFVMSVLLRGGAIFIVIWNASLWGTIFGALAKHAASATGQNPWLVLGLIFVIVLPHALLEACSYIVSTVSGSMLSSSILKKEFMSAKFKTGFQNAIYLLLIAVVVVILAGFVETFVLGISTYQQIIAAAF